MIDSIKFIKPGKAFMGRLSRGADLLDEITAFCTEKNIRLGRVEAIGAVEKARFGFYNQETRNYQYIEINEPLEIVSLIGNVSLKDDKLMVHAHIALADREGRSYGGHLSSGTVIFACEIMVFAFEGPEFIRKFDKETGLFLWDNK